MNVNPLHASHPNLNTVVSASAGTGKTWMLTTRIVRLLLAGAEPSSILAVTFTRKATAEMRERVYERIHSLHVADDDELSTLLNMMGIDQDPATQTRARQLYPNLISGTSDVRVRTFHSFCQDLLQRFPLEADVPPGFALLESQGMELEATWEALNVKATQYPNGNVAKTLEAFFKQCGTLDTAKKLAFEFVEKASDWWAYTEGQEHPVTYATEQLKKQSNVPNDVYEPLKGIQTDLATLAEQFQQRKTSINIEKYLTCIGNARLHPEDKHHTFTSLVPFFLKADFTPRAYNNSATLEKQLGWEQAEQHVALVADVANKLVAVLEYQKRQIMLDMNTAWYAMGELLLNEYQKAKTQKNQLDFSDLEWKTYQLLHHADNAEWVQYKLDQRINHLLFDEFQDTNPTQWQLVRPLLNELASGEKDVPKTVFLVGDTKQSIYGFRRANPELQVEASRWLQASLNASEFTLNLSRRSSQAIMGVVNAVFNNKSVDTHLTGFETHDTVHKNLWGRVECLPLIIYEEPKEEKPEDDAPLPPLRNPLIEPKPVTHRDHHYQEAKQVATRIGELMANNTAIKDGDDYRALRYSDIYVLFKRRTHLKDFERVFKEADIPFFGSTKGTFFDHIEVQDMEALLNFLIAPFDNYGLAGILRSPLFQATHEDLLTLAQMDNKHWWHNITQHVSQPNPSAPLQKAHRLLSQWMTLATELPVHDLLDTLYHQGDVLAHYASAAKPENKKQTVANLTQFLHLALDTNSGRYPSLTHFLDSLPRMRSAYVNEQTDQANITDNDDCVQLMTVHSSKGMEAPVIFLVDTFSADSAPKAWESLVEWPSNTDRPTHFLINPKKDDTCDLHQDLLAQKQQRASHEDDNLLYVAMTRAKHMLVVSGSCKEADFHSQANPDKKKKRWYPTIHKALDDALNNPDTHKELLGDLGVEFETTDNGTLVMSSGAIPSEAMKSGKHEVLTTQSDNQLDTCTLDWKNHTPDTRVTVVNPSKLGDLPPQPNALNHATDNAQHIGIYTHALLERMTNSTGSAMNHVQAENSRLKLSEEEQALCQSMAEDTFNNETLAFLFRPTPNAVCHNEVGLTYTNANGERVYGVIDRLVMEEDCIWIVDYKSTQGVTENSIQAHAEEYKKQLVCYTEGIRKLYPNKKVCAGIVFTELKQWVLVVG